MPRWPAKQKNRVKTPQTSGTQEALKLKRSVRGSGIFSAPYGDNAIEIYPTAVVEGASELTGHVRPSHYGGPEAIHEVKNCLLAWGIKDNAYLYQAICMLARVKQKSKNPAEYIENLSKAKTWIQFEIDEVKAQIERGRDEAGHNTTSYLAPGE